MKHIFLIFLIIFSFNAFAKDDGLKTIKHRGYIVCGTKFDVKPYFYKDKEGFIQGIDANMCKIFALAIFNNSNSYKMLDISNKDSSQVLANKEVDVVLGGLANSASQESSTNLNPASFFYYDSLMFLTKNKDKDSKTSMQDYKNANVCTVKDGFTKYGLETYSSQYKLNFNFLNFATKQRAKEAFLLNRCQLLPGSEIYLTSIKGDNQTIIKEKIATIPVSIFVEKNNQSLKTAIKWIVNALIVAEEKGFSKANISIPLLSQEQSMQSLLGDNPKVWQQLGLNPTWFKKAIKEFGNYGDFYDQNIGSLGIKREKNNLIKNDGLLKGELFL